MSDPKPLTPEGQRLRDGLRSVLVHAGMRPDMADRWHPRIDAALYDDGWYHAERAAQPAPTGLREAAQAAAECLDGIALGYAPERHRLQAAAAAVRVALTNPTSPLTGRDIWREWRDGMLAQGRAVAPERMAWNTLDQRDRDLDDGIAARLNALDAAAAAPALDAKGCSECDYRGYPCPDHHR